MNREQMPRMHRMPIGDAIDKDTEILHCAHVSNEARRLMQNSPGFMAIILDQSGNVKVATALNTHDLRVGDIVQLHNAVYNWMSEWAQAAAQDMTNVQAVALTEEKPGEDPDA